MIFVKVELKYEFGEEEGNRIALLIQEIGALSDKYKCDESWEIKQVD